VKRNGEGNLTGSSTPNPPSTRTRVYGECTRRIYRVHIIMVIMIDDKNDDNDDDI